MAIPLKGSLAWRQNLYLSPIPGDKTVSNDIPNAVFKFQIAFWDDKNHH